MPSFPAYFSARLFSVALRTGVLASACFTTALGAEKFNLITIVTDDQAAWTLGCYGGPDAVTPHLDALAQRGAKSPWRE